MSNLIENLEELQRDILQGDLSKNQYLQSSTVPLLDKELKTKAKKIIPAINELLKIINTFSDGITTFMHDINNEVSELKNDMKTMNESIKELSNKDEKTNKNINNLNKKYDECIKRAAAIELSVELVNNEYKSEKYNLNFKEDKMKLKSKFKLDRNESVSIGSVDELYDPEKQIKIYAYEESSKKYKYINYNFDVEISRDSVYKFDVRPIELQIEDESRDEILVNMSNWQLIIFIYEYKGQ